MKYQFEFTRKAEKELMVLPQILQQRIFQKLTYWEKAGNPLSSAKKLQNLEQKYRFRVGDYRIIVTPKNQHILIILLILKIGHR